MKPERWRHIDKLLGEALELEASRRAVFLDQACAGDDELRRKIDALLAAHEQAENFIEAPAITAAAQKLAEEARSIVGRELGHYEVLALVGAGGMGAVWKAKDTRLDRAVAIKTLPSEFERHPDRLVRFEREAKLLASLNHPNIAAIHGLDEDRGRRFLVLEFVEGETLADRLHRGAIPLNEALKLARQIADALEAAHENGVIHRDLKPANIKITRDGTVKVLDFGLAKPVAADPFKTDRAASPAIKESTEPGVVLGTAAYMAPEQARGKTVDRRADIWAFGVVFYEMVTGTRPFERADPTETLASVVMKEPDFDRVPAQVRRLLRKCLEKDPKNRLRDIADAWELLTDAAQTQAAPRSVTLSWILTAAALAIAIVVVFSRWPQPAPVQVNTFDIHAPAESLLPPGTPAISDDGRKFAYTVVGPDDVTRLYVYDAETGKPKALPGTEGAFHPMWLPSGKSLVFAADGGFKRIDLESESVHPLVRDWAQPNNLWRAWIENNDILVYRAGQRQLFRISSADAGVPTPIPGSGPPEVDNITGVPVLARTPDGKVYLLFLRESDLMVQEFDKTSGKVLGKPRLLFPRIAHIHGRPAIGVSPAGHLAYQSAQEATAKRLRIVDRLGQTLQTFSPDKSVVKPRLSPDQRSVAGLRSSSGLHVWVTDLDRGSSDQKTFGDTGENFVVWSRDGLRLAFLKIERGIYALNIAGGGTELLSPIKGVPTSLSERHLLYTFPIRPRDPDAKLYMLEIGGLGEAIPVGSPNGNSYSGEFSPDGSYIAFGSRKSRQAEVYVRPTPPRTGETIPVSINGGELPRWRGREIFFVSPEGGLMAADITLGDKVSVGIPHLLFRFDFDFDWEDGYDVFKDGQRFLILSPSEEVDSPITVIQNWWVRLK